MSVYSRPVADVLSIPAVDVAREIPPVVPFTVRNDDDVVELPATVVVPR